MTPVPVVRKVAPLSCRVCGGTRDLVTDDGPTVCRACIREAGVMGQATVRRSDTPDGNEPRDGQWR